MNTAVSSSTPDDLPVSNPLREQLKRCEYRITSIACKVLAVFACCFVMCSIAGSIAMNGRLIDLGGLSSAFLPTVLYMLLWGSADFQKGIEKIQYNLSLSEIENLNRLPEEEVVNMRRDISPQRREKIRRLHRHTKAVYQISQRCFFLAAAQVYVWPSFFVVGSRYTSLQLSLLSLDFIEICVLANTVILAYATYRAKKKFECSYAELTELNRQARNSEV